MLEPIFLACCLQNKLIPGAFCAKESLIIFIRPPKVSFSANNEWVADSKMRLLRHLNIYQGDEFFLMVFCFTVYIWQPANSYLPKDICPSSLEAMICDHKWVQLLKTETAFLLSIHPPSLHPGINHCHSIDFSRLAPINTSWQPSPIFSKS